MSLLVSAANAVGDYVVFATKSQVVASGEFQVHLGTFNSQLELVIKDDLSLVEVERLCRDHAIDHVVVPDGDSFAYALAKGHAWTWRGSITVLVMREKGQPSRFPGVTFAKTVAKVLLLQAANLRPRIQVRVLKSAIWKGHSLLPVSRDPVTFSTFTETNNNSFAPILTDQFFWFGVLGKVSHRKNLPLVASALAAVNRADVALVVAGQIEEGVLDLAQPALQRIRDRGGCVTIVNRLLTDIEMDDLIRRIDCAVLAHSNEGPSGILGKAAAAGTRVVAAGASSLRIDCRNIGPGAEWAPLKESHLSFALARAISQPGPLPSQNASAGEFAAGLLGHKP
ncbi:glycosyltransferase [Arthrobacter sp. SLBN-112]|uniref:glycosyltransferase n=1 Tax=Arthrobacter sp. SLBN-112 TaxID=2768452 RepID=UPI0027B832C2|nr:glycosyltransferase [Arthrobacter sp. SLBN-112]MDQ0800078.1 glycosyltransferase involved in cell wall biosynthesis [Arthrobacter sp. SLBN-112]